MYMYIGARVQVEQEFLYFTSYITSPFRLAAARRYNLILEVGSIVELVR